MSSHDEELLDIGRAQHPCELLRQETCDPREADDEYCQALFMLNDDDVLPLPPDHSVEEELCREAEGMDAFYEAAREKFSQLSPTPRDDDMPMPSFASEAHMVSEDNHTNIIANEDECDDPSFALHPRYRLGARHEFWSDSD